MAGSNGVDLTGPLAGMWRDVYRKAGAVAEARTTEQMNGHVYVYHPVAYAPYDHSHPSTHSAVWRWLTIDTIADPGPGNANGDTGASTTPTRLALSRTTENGTALPDVANGLAAGDSVYLQDRDDATRWTRFAVTAAPEVSPTYLVIPVAVDGTSGVNVAHDQPVVVQFTLAAGGGGGGADTGPWVDEAGDTMTGPLIHQGATTTSTVVQHKLATDTEPRFAADASGKLQWGAGGTDPLTVYLERNAGPGLSYWGNTLLPLAIGAALGQESNGRTWGEVAGRELHLVQNTSYLRVGQVGDPAPPAAAGALRLRRVGEVHWRNEANTADHTLGVSSAGALLFDGAPVGGGGGGGTGNTTMHTQTSAPTGAPNSLWFDPSESA